MDNMDHLHMEDVYNTAVAILPAKILTTGISIVRNIDVYFSNAILSRSPKEDYVVYATLASTLPVKIIIMELHIAWSIHAESMDAKMQLLPKKENIAEIIPAGKLGVNPS